MKRYLTLFFCLLIITALSANGTTVFSEENRMQRISSLQILEDKSGELKYEDVLVSDSFLISEKEIPNLQVSSSTFWIKFELQNESELKELALMLEAPTIDEVTFYTPGENGEVVTSKMGEHNPFHKRSYDDPNYIFDIEILPGKKQTYFLKVKSTEQMMIPLSVGSRKHVLEFIADNNIIFGLYAGFILVMFFYNLFVYFIVRDNGYLYYISPICYLLVSHSCL